MITDQVFFTVRKDKVNRHKIPDSIIVSAGYQKSAKESLPHCVEATKMIYFIQLIHTNGEFWIP